MVSLEINRLGYRSGKNAPQRDRRYGGWRCIRGEDVMLVAGCEGNRFKGCHSMVCLFQM